MQETSGEGYAEMAVQNDSPWVPAAREPASESGIIGNHRPYSYQDGIHPIPYLMDIVPRGCLGNPPGVACRGSGLSVQRCGEFEDDKGDMSGDIFCEGFVESPALRF